MLEFVPQVASPGLTTKCGAWTVSGWSVVSVQPWSRFFCTVCPILVVVGSPFASRFLWLWVSTLYRPSLLCMQSSAKLVNEIRIIILLELVPQVAPPGLTTKCGAWPVTGWPVVPVQPWSRFLSVHYLSYTGCSRFSLCLQVSLATGKHLVQAQACA